MSSIATALKAEIQRVARKEIRSQIEVTRKATLQHRRDIAELKRQLKALEQTNRALRKAAAAGVEPPSDEDVKPIRFSAKGLHSLRVRLGLSAQELAQLLGVAAQSIYNWEQKKSAPREAQVQAIVAARSLTKKTARARLEEIQAQSVEQTPAE